MDVIKRRDAFLFVSPSPSMDSPGSVHLLDSGAKNYTTVPTGTNVTWEQATLSPIVSRVVSVPTSVATASTAEGTSALQGAAMAAQALVLLSIFLLSSVGNSAVAVVIIKHRRLRTATNAFILSLSLSDLLAAVLCLPVSFVTLFSGDGAWVFGERFCVANGFFNTCFGIVSTLTMTLISFDRYPSPYRYYAIVRQPQAKIGRREAARLLAGVWLTAVLFSLPWGLLARVPPAVTATEVATATAAGANHKRGFHHCVYAFHTGGAAHSVSLVAVCFLLPFALMCFCHYGICRTVRLSEVRVRPATTYACLLRFHGEVRTATTVLLMIVFVVVCRGPYCLVGLAAALGDRHAFSPAVVTVAIWLAWANGAVNPVIYALRNPNISTLLGRGGREEGYRTGGAAGRAQIHEMRLNQVGLVRERYASHVRANQHHQQQQHSRHSSSTNRCTTSSSPGHAGSGPGAEVATWAYKNPAVLFCRDLQLNTPSDGNGVAPKMKTADTSL